MAFANDLASVLVGQAIAVGVSIREEIPSSTIDATRNEGHARWVRDIDTPTERTLQLTVHPLQGAESVDADSAGEVWILQDITRQPADERAIREKDERLSQAEKMDAVGRIAGGLAHDFNNLVTIMMGYSRLAIDDIQRGNPAAEVKKNVEGVYETARRSS